MNRPSVRTARLALAAAALLTAGPSASSQVVLDWDAIAERLVRQIDPQPGERALLVGVPGRFDPLVALLREKLGARGAVDLGAVALVPPRPGEWRTEFSESLRGRGRRDLVARLRTVDVAVMMPGADSSHLVYSAMQDVLRDGHGRTVHFHWSGNFTPAMLSHPVDDAVDEILQRAILDVDYGALAGVQQRFATAIRQAPVRVTTPAGTDISFRVDQRPVTRQDGDASHTRTAHARNLIDREVEFPAGAIRVAPIESTVAGTIVISDSSWNGRLVEEVRLSFEAGKVVEFEASSDLDAVERTITRGADSTRSFREFGLGFNPLLRLQSEPEPWIPSYGYGAGIVRLSLGDNQELGGAVTGGSVVWQFFVDATVTVGDVTWVLDGTLTPPPPPR